MFLVDSIQRLFLGAGAAWVLWFLLALALASLAIALERALFFRGRGGDLAALSRSAGGRLWPADMAGARAVLSGTARGCRRCRRRRPAGGDLGPAAAEKAMQGACAVERERLEARLAFLGTLGNNAPFVGLFGTVIGVIQAFEQLGVGSQGSAGQAVSQAVMAGIAEALIATAVGIGVALPAVAFYNYFQRRIAACCRAPRR